MTRFDKFKGQLAMILSAAWRPVRENARKLIPSRSVRWTVLYVPAFTVTLLFAAKTFGYDDLVAYVIEVGTKSLPVLIGIAITYVLATGLGWNLDNEERAYYQRVLTCSTRPGELEGSQWGAFAVLAGEMLSILALLVIIHRALLVLQG